MKSPSSAALPEAASVSSSSEPSQPPTFPSSPSWRAFFSRSPGAPGRPLLRGARQCQGSSASSRRGGQQHPSKGAGATSTAKAVAPLASRPGRTSLFTDEKDADAGKDGGGSSSSSSSGGGGGEGGSACRSDEEGNGERILSTSSLGRNQRLSLERLLAPSSSFLMARSADYSGPRHHPRNKKGDLGDLFLRNAPSFETTIKPAPFLTLALHKLDEILPDFCRQIADPSLAPLACSALESSLATATTATTVTSTMTARSDSRKQRKDIGTGGDMARSEFRDGRSSVVAGMAGTSITTGTSSPIMGSIFGWFAPPSSSSLHADDSKHTNLGRVNPSIGNPMKKWRVDVPTPSSPSSFPAMAMEGDWGAYSAPFFLLAAAEVLYHDLDHLACIIPFDPDTATDRTLLETPQQQVPFIVPLAQLYQRIVKDLVLVKQVLCEPLLPVAMTSPGAAIEESADVPAVAGAASSAAASPTDAVKRSTEAAKAVASILDDLVTVCNARIQLVTLQHNLFSAVSSVLSSRDVDSPESTVGDVSTNDRRSVESGADPVAAGSDNVADRISSPIHHQSMARSSSARLFAEAVTAIDHLQNSLPASETKNGTEADEQKGGDDDEDATPQKRPCTQGLFGSIHSEGNSWKYCLEAAMALERCRFLQAILSLRHFRACVLARKSMPMTALDLWFRAAFLRFASFLPVYFDRTQAFSSALYGYDTGLFMQGKTIETDWNAAVVEFLRRQKGGSPMAVALVLDAGRAGTNHVEKGLQFTSLLPPSDATAELDEARVRWPAVYMRSTHRLSTASQPSSRPSLVHGSSGYLTSTSQGSMLQNWSIVGSSSSVSGVSSVPTKAPLIFSKASVLEYAPDSGKVGWPHSDWVRLSVLLRNRQQQAPHSDDPNVIDDETSTENTERGPLPSHASHDFSISMHEMSSLMVVPTSFDRPNAFHVCTVGDFLSLVAIVGSDGDEYRWRRRTGLTDEEIRSYLFELASQLRVARSFTAIMIPRGELDERMMKNLRATLKNTRKTKQLDVIGCDASCESRNRARSSLTDETAQAILRDVKIAFGLRPVSPLAHDTLRSTTTLSPASRRILAQHASSLAPFRFRLTSGQLSDIHEGRQLTGRSTADDESILRLFLGSDLAPFFL